MGKLYMLILTALLLRGMTATGATTVTNFARGSWANHSFLIKSDGSLWGMGINNHYQLGLGLGSQANYVTPQQIVSSNVMSVAMGTDYSVFLKSDGSLLGMGHNGSGGLGLPTNMTVFSPIEIPLSNVIAVAVGSGHSLFLKSDGSLWGVGDDSFGQLGDGGNYRYGSPPGPRQIEQIVSNSVTTIAAGQFHSLFIKSDGSLWGMGMNAYGQLGDGNPASPQFYPDYDSFTNWPVKIIPSNVVAVAAGRGHSLFLKSDGSLWAMGWNAYGQLGDGSFNYTNLPELIVASNVTTIAAGGYHSLFLKSDGSLWAMGRNFKGQLGNGNYSNDATALNCTNQPEQIVASNVVAIAAGQNHSLFLKADGSLWGMGDNYYGQLGDGFVDYNTMPIPGVDKPEQISPPPSPVLSLALAVGGDLQLSASCGFGGNFCLDTSTNITQTLSNWTPVVTNIISDRKNNVFSAMVTNSINSRSQFYILRSQ